MYFANEADQDSYDDEAPETNPGSKELEIQMSNYRAWSCAGVACMWLVFLPVQAKEWELRKQTRSNICHVQRSTSSPKLGDLLSEHDTRKAACLEGRAQYDPEMADTSKCFGYSKGAIDGCKSDGVILLNKSVKRGPSQK